ncbi:OST-HTH/LOTUS domain-containing protein [Brachybacterium sp. DNPG3]
MQFDDGRGRREDEAVDLTWHGDHDDLGDDDDRDDEDLDEVAARLLERAMHLSDPDESEWLHSSAVKTYMRRMDPSFSEKALGFRSFSDFLKHFDDVVELSERGTERLVRIRDDVL